MYLSGNKSAEEEAVMMDPVLYRKRLIPEECVLLKDDIILYRSDCIIVTKWNTLKPKRRLHHGLSCYFLKEGFKISKFYAADDILLYYYCDIISPEYNEKDNTLIVTDLLVDVIIYPDGFVKVVDMDELALALDNSLVHVSDLKKALLSLDSLLKQIYSGKLGQLLEPIDRYDSMVRPSL